jgi:hypothetical protein
LNLTSLGVSARRKEFINNFGCNWRLNRKILMEKKRIKLALTKRNEEPMTKFEKKAKLKV